MICYVDKVGMLVPLDVILFICALEIRGGIVADPVVYHEAKVIFQSVSCTCQIMVGLKGH